MLAPMRVPPAPEGSRIQVLSLPKSVQGLFLVRGSGHPSLLGAVGEQEVSNSHGIIAPLRTDGWKMTNTEKERDLPLEGWLLEEIAQTAQDKVFRTTLQVTLNSGAKGGPL